MHNFYVQTKDNTKLLLPTIDVVFQALFGTVGNESFTKHFLELILDKKINSIDLSSNPILRRKHIDGKLGILDVIAKIDNNELCNIEMQVSSQKNILERLLYYWSRTYSDQLKIGDNYGALQKTIGILIADFEIKGLEELNYRSSWKIIEEKNRKIILTDRLEICIIELPKIANLQNNDELLMWLKFLTMPHSEEVIEMAKTNTELKKAYNKLEEMSSNEQMRKFAEWRYMGMVEHNSAISSSYDDGYNSGEKNGYNRGKKDGYNSGKKDLVKKMLVNGENINKIILYSGFSLQEIEKLKKELNLN